MATITDSDLIDLRDALQALNDTFSGINWDVFTTLGGDPRTNVEVSSVTMQTSDAKELEVAAEINKISGSLVWLTDVVNALFSISNISLETESPTEITTIRQPSGRDKS